MKISTGVNPIQGAHHRLPSGTTRLDLPILPSASMVVLTLEDADRKLEALTHEALTVFGQLMGRGQDEGVRLNVASAVLRAWQKGRRDL